MQVPSTNSILLYSTVSCIAACKNTSAPCDACPGPTWLICRPSRHLETNSNIHLFIFLQSQLPIGPFCLSKDWESHPQTIHRSVPRTTQTVRATRPGSPLRAFLGHSEVGLALSVVRHETCFGMLEDGRIHAKKVYIEPSTRCLLRQPRKQTRIGSKAVPPMANIFLSNEHLHSKFPMFKSPILSHSIGDM